MRLSHETKHTHSMAGTKVVLVKVVRRTIKSKSAPNQTCAYIQSLKPGQDTKHWGGGFCVPPPRVIFTSGSP